MGARTDRTTSTHIVSRGLLRIGRSRRAAPLVRRAGHPARRSCMRTSRRAANSIRWRHPARRGPRPRSASLGRGPAATGATSERSKWVGRRPLMTAAGCRPMSVSAMPIDQASAAAPASSSSHQPWRRARVDERRSSRRRCRRACDPFAAPITELRRRRLMASSRMLSAHRRRVTASTMSRARMPHRSMALGCSSQSALSARHAGRAPRSSSTAYRSCEHDGGRAARRDGARRRGLMLQRHGRRVSASPVQRRATAQRRRERIPRSGRQAVLVDHERDRRRAPRSRASHQELLELDHVRLRLSWSCCVRTCKASSADGG